MLPALSFHGRCTFLLFCLHTDDRRLFRIGIWKRHGQHGLSGCVLCYMFPGKVSVDEVRYFPKLQWYELLKHRDCNRDSEQIKPCLDCTLLVD